jgi:phenylacetate-CoA ligase
MVTPSYMLVLAEEFERQGLDPAQSSLSIGMFGAEPWTAAMRREIEQKMAIDAIDLYGLSEVMGPGVACECLETKDGPTLWEDHFYPEIIDPVTGEVLPDGEEGELVFTSLTKEAFPIIRYRTRDLTRLLAPSARAFRRMDKIVGRSDDMLIIRGVNVFPSQIEELILQDARLNGHYMLVVSREAHLDHLEVRCELGRDVSASIGSRDRESVGKQLQHRIKSLIGVSTKVCVHDFDSIPRTQVGKAKRVQDERHLN